jgi:hypothetical protein
MIKRAFLTTLLFLVTAGSAKADTVTVSATVGQPFAYTTDNVDDEGYFNEFFYFDAHPAKFNPALGTLTGVQVHLYIEAIGFFENDTDAFSEISVGAGHPEVPGENETQYALLEYDGGATPFEVCFETDNAETSASTLNDYVGYGTIDVPAYMWLHQAAHLSAPLGTQAEIMGSISLIVSVTYTYTPAP